MVEEPKIVLDEKIGYHTCLCHEGFHHPNMNELLFLYDSFKKGIMPFKGCVTEQPAQIIEAFQLLEHLYFEREQELRKKSERK